QENLDTMLASVDKIATVPKDSSAYHTGMMDVSDRALLIKTNIMDATPYMYVSVANLMFTTVWIAALLGIFAALKRKKEQLKEADEVGV
ncbi:MAG: glycosyl transferase, partial [Nitrosopumilaceae archaeon]|nr:glycosyl transferase [Nitrosopumilaceae archaeon]